jgi:hypothetical protein
MASPGQLGAAVAFMVYTSTTWAGTKHNTQGLYTCVCACFAGRWLANSISQLDVLLVQMLLCKSDGKYSWLPAYGHPQWQALHRNPSSPMKTFNVQTIL